MFTPTAVTESEQNLGLTKPLKNGIKAKIPQRDWLFESTVKCPKGAAAERDLAVFYFFREGKLCP